MRVSRARGIEIVSLRAKAVKVMNPYQGRYTDVESFRPMDWLLAADGSGLFGDRILVDGPKGYTQAFFRPCFLCLSDIDCAVRFSNSGR